VVSVPSTVVPDVVVVVVEGFTLVVVVVMATPAVDDIIIGPTEVELGSAKQCNQILHSVAMGCRIIMYGLMLTLFPW